MKKIILSIPGILMACATLAQPLPNGDFELWNTKYYAHPDTGWFTSNGQSLASHDSLTVWSVPGFSGQAIHIETAIIGPDTLKAGISNIPGNPYASAGGVPYTQQPTAITGYMRYNVLGGDTALLWVRFKKAGAVVSSDVMRITGSASVFASFSFPLTLSMVPDSMIITASSSNLLNAGGIGITGGSWLELDQLAFTGPGVTRIIPGGSFDGWTPDTLQSPQGWQGPPGGGPSGVTQTTDFYSGSYAVQLVTQPGGGPGGTRLAAITTGAFNTTGPPIGGLPYTSTVDTLEGYYKYAGVGTDSGLVNVTLRNAGMNVGGGRLSLGNASGYTYFEVPITAMMTPDTIRIDIYSSKIGPGSAPAVGSTLKVDKLQLRAHTPALAISEPGNIKLRSNVVVYPNPVTDMLNIGFAGAAKGIVTVKLYDAGGRLVADRGYAAPGATLQVPVAQLAGGIYFYEVKNNGSVTKGRFCKMAQ